MIWTCQPAPCHSRLMRELRACRLQMLPFAGISGFRVVARNDSGGDYSQSPCTRYELQMDTGGGNVLFPGFRVAIYLYYFSCSIAISGMFKTVLKKVFTSSAFFT